MTAEKFSPRIKIDGVPIGCPILSGDAPCHPCAGGWPGTTKPGEHFIRVAKEGRLRPENMPCGTLQNQAHLLVKKFSPNGK